MRSALAFAALSLATALLLTGCTPQDPDVLPPPEQSTEPVFASDEEALAAATDAYKAYLAMSDLIAQDGGVNPERIAPLVTEEWLEKELAAFNSFVGSGRHQVGNATFESPRLQQYTTDLDGNPIVGAYYCLDSSGTRIVTADGIDVTPTTRAARITVEVLFAGAAQSPHLQVDGMAPWPSTGTC